MEFQLGLRDARWRRDVQEAGRNEKLRPEERSALENKGMRGLGNGPGRICFACQSWSDGMQMCGKDSGSSRSFVMGLSVEKGLEPGSTRSHRAKRKQKRSGLRPGSWPIFHR